VIDDDGAAGGQIDLAGIGGFDLMLNLEAGEEGNIILVTLDPIDVVGHDRAHEGFGLLENFVRIDEQFADVRLEVIPDGPDHQTAFQIDEEGAGLLGSSAFYGAPQLQQVVQVPLQLFRAAADGGGTGDQAHALGGFQLIHDVPQFGPFVPFHATGNAAAPGIVGHQHQVTASQGNEGGKGCALIATFIFFNLNNDFLAFLQGFLDGGLAGFHAGLEVGAGNFLEREKTVSFLAVIDKSGLETRFDAGNDTLVNIAFALFLGGRFNV